VQDDHGVYRVHGTFTAAVSATAAWRVLTDYEHIGEFVKAVRTSKQVEAPDGRRVLEQDAVAGTFPFRRTIRVHLSIREDANRRIEFRDVLARDFQRYVGAWTLDAGSDGTKVGYELEAEPLKKFPGFVGRAIMAHSARDLLNQVRAEMLHRVAIARAASDRAAAQP